MGKKNLLCGGQAPRQFEKQITKTVACNYLLYLPEDYAKDPGKKWPLMLFLHGAGERGSDIEKVKLHGPPKLIAQGQNFPFIIVSPQCPEEGWWPRETEMLLALLDDIESTYNVDKKRIYLTGLSMGGFGTWELARACPERFAAIAPICGGGEYYLVAPLKDVPIWTFHGAKDNVVPIRRTIEMVEALKKIKGNVKFTVYPEAEHDSWTQTYENPQLYEWFLTHEKK